MCSSDLFPSHDSFGESFDKVSKMLKLGYPGGPIVEKYAKNGDENRFSFPIPLSQSPNIDILNVYAINNEDIIRIMPNMAVNISQNSRDRFGSMSYNISERFENWKEGKLCSLENLIALQKVKCIQKNVK